MVNLLRNMKWTKFANILNLAPIPHQPRTVANNCTVGFDLLNLALINTRSLAGQSFLIHDHRQTQS